MSANDKIEYSAQRGAANSTWDTIYLARKRGIKSILMDSNTIVKCLIEYGRMPSCSVTGWQGIREAVAEENGTDIFLRIRLCKDKSIQENLSCIGRRLQQYVDAGEMNKEALECALYSARRDSLYLSCDPGKKTATHSLRAVGLWLFDRLEGGKMTLQSAHDELLAFIDSIGGKSDEIRSIVESRNMSRLVKNTGACVKAGRTLNMS